MLDSTMREILQGISLVMRRRDMMLFTLIDFFHCIVIFIPGNSCAIKSDIVIFIFL